MGKNQLETNDVSKDLWSRLFFDAESKIVEVVNPDKRLFFGREPVAGMTADTLAGEDWRAKALRNSIRRALSEKRNVFAEYLSIDGQGVQTHVVAHIEYRNQNSLCLYATAVDETDLKQSHTNLSENIRDIEVVLRVIYDNLPLGLEIYDREGHLIDTNAEEMRIIGISDKNQVVGLNLFENPNLPLDIRQQLLAGKDVHFTQAYDYALAGEYFNTSKSSTCDLNVTISILRNAAGEVDKYLLVSQDISEHARYRRQYETLYSEYRTILNSLPVGVEVYSPEGEILYLNDADCQIFGVNRDDVIRNSISIHDNPNLPEALKEAVRQGIPAQQHFPYSFKTVNQHGYYETAKTESLQIECNGRPVLNAAGKLENYVFIVQDVTESVRFNEELRQSRQKAQIAVQAADIVIWEFDVRRGIFYSENEPINDHNQNIPLTIEDYIERIHPDDKAAAIANIQQMLGGDESSFNLDVRMQIPGYPEWQYCNISGAPYQKDADDKVIKYVGSRKNNTEIEVQKILQERILNSIPLPIHIKDVENNFRYYFCNEESERMFGTNTEKTIYDVMSPEQVARIEKTDKEVFVTGKPYFGLERIELKDGRSYDMIVRKSVIYVNDKRLLLNVRWDQGLQNELERRSKMLTISMNAMKAYTWFYEPDKDRVTFGDGIEHMGKKTTQFDTLDKFAACIHPDDRYLFTNSLRSLLPQTSGEWKVEYRVDLNGTGMYEWWETRGMLETILREDIPCQYMFGISINIESHKQTELMLIQNKEKLKELIHQNEMVLNNTNSGLAYITTDYIVKWENVSKCSKSISFEAYKQGEYCYKSVHNRTAPCEDCVMQRAIESRLVERNKFSLDNKHTIEVFASPVFNEDGTTDGVVVRVDDITEREMIIEELRKAKALAEQSDKLKSAFLANMSHEIRTPLNAIVGFSELLMNATEDEERNEYLRIINNNNELLLKLINDILDLSKIEAGSVELKYEEFDLAEEFNGMSVSMKQRVTNPNLQLITTNPHAKCLVRLDKNRIAQIITNYVTNAIKYTPKGSIEMGYETVDNGIRIYVKDDGIGISESKKDKVFHRFEKLDEFAQGTGLGLSICKAIAESMGGSVGFESQEGKGSTFWALLPCEPQIFDIRERKGRSMETDTTTPTNTVSPETTETPARKTILVAEDIASNYLLVSVMLRKYFDLLHAENGQEAVEMARTKHPDVVLMDMKMPVMDGLTATAEIRKFDSKLPIIALTAHAFEADRIAALEAGCNDYLVKPIDKGKLMGTLRKYCPEEI